MSSIEEDFFSGCKDGDLEKVKTTGPKLENINLKTSEGWTGLIMSVFNGHYDVAEYLISIGADVNATNHKGTSVFMYAKTPVLSSNNPAVLDLLINKGANINSTDSAGKTVLDYVKEKNNERLTMWLISKGAKEGTSKTV